MGVITKMNFLGGRFYEFRDIPLKVKVQYNFGVAKISNIFGAWLILIW